MFTSLTSVVVPVVAVVLAASVPDARCEVRGLGLTCRSALADFEGAVGQYAELHRRLAAPLAARWLTADAEQLAASVATLGRAIREARPDAAAGDIFTPPVASLIRRTIRGNLRANGYDPGAIAGADEEEARSGWDRLAVNAPFPWQASAFTWPSILAALPALPAEVEYRFVGRTLVLLDVDANLVVDLLNDALPAPADPEGLRREAGRTSRSGSGPGRD